MVSTNCQQPCDRTGAGARGLYVLNTNNMSQNMSNSAVLVFDKNSKNRVRRALEGQFSYKKLLAAEWHQFIQNYNYDDDNGPLEVDNRATTLRQRYCIVPLLAFATRSFM